MNLLTIPPVRNAALQLHTSSESTLRGKVMKIIRKVIKYNSKEDNRFFLIPIGDIHIGHRNVEKLMKHRPFAVESGGGG